MSATAFQRMRRERAKVVQGEDKQLSEMTVVQLEAYAKEKDIDIGKATSKNGILEKIKSIENKE